MAYPIKDTRKFNKQLNDVKKEFQPRISLVRKENNEITSHQAEIIDNWKRYFDEHLNSYTRLSDNENQHITQMMQL